MSTRMVGNARDHYMDLVCKFPLASIKSERQLQEAQAVLDKVLATGRLSKGQLIYVDVLSDLVMAYENSHHPMPSPSDAAILQHLMKAKAITQQELHQATKIAPSTISEILSGKRRFTKGMIGALAAYFGVDKGMFAANF